MTERERVLLSALKRLHEETQDWEDALGDERPTLVEARRQATVAMATVEGR